MGRQHIWRPRPGGRPPCGNRVGGAANYHRARDLHHRSHLAQVNHREHATINVPATDRYASGDRRGTVTVVDDSDPSDAQAHTALWDLARNCEFDSWLDLGIPDLGSSPA